MQDNIKDDRQTVYEIGYLIATSVAEENVPIEADKVRMIVTDAGAEIIAEEAPHKQHLAYTMRVKTVSGSYEKYDEAYFGWVKFELGSSKIEEVKKAVELLPSMLRMLLITTTAENTYLGKRAQAFAAAFSPAPKRAMEFAATEKEVVAPLAAPATVEEMDKSIDEMVKEA